jgi:hypothetical protein
MNLDECSRRLYIYYYYTEPGLISAEVRDFTGRRAYSIKKLSK